MVGLTVEHILRKRIAELEAENKRLLDQLKRIQDYYAELVELCDTLTHQNNQTPPHPKT